MDAEYVAAMCNDLSCLNGELCDVTILTRDAECWVVHSMQTRWDADPNDQLNEATNVLAAHGWRIAPDDGWTWGDTAAYVSVERVSEA